MVSGLFSLFCIMYRIVYVFLFLLMCVAFRVCMLLWVMWPKGEGVLGWNSQLYSQPSPSSLFHRDALRDFFLECFFLPSTKTIPNQFWTWTFSFFPGFSSTQNMVQFFLVFEELSYGNQMDSREICIVAHHYQHCIGLEKIKRKVIYWTYENLYSWKCCN